MMLTPDEQHQAEKVFEAALDLPAAEREGFIVAHCGDNAAVADEVRLLVKHYEAAPPDFMQSPSSVGGEAHPDETIGPYELKEVLGEGGMGVVYRAEQSEPVVRSVALKVLKLGMDSRAVLARFEAERQVLADLEHPNIARVYDAGTTAAGRPYFVMEYIKGQGITYYCDNLKLPTRPRIELFVKMCRGVQHAHQKGIIHRDLKPMNILVANVDGIAQPKVIDFGVAKAIEQGLSEATLFTPQGQLIGTPEYMSPEQAEFSSVDTRTDVYSLGVVLYELLAGALPIDGKTLRESGIRAMMKLIREKEPLLPSVQVDSEVAMATTVASTRNVEPRVLANILRGDLDWIVLKALEKDPERRYSTVAELAADLERYLADRPVLARPASAWYLMGKFARRHRVGVGVVVTALCALILLGINITLQSQRVARERDRANHEAAVSRHVKDFLVDIFFVSDPSDALGTSLSAREILDRGADRIGELEDDASRAELTGALAAVYQNLGVYGKSDSLFVAAMDIWLATEGMENPGTLEAIGAVAGVYKALGRLAAAESLYAVAGDGWEDIGLAADIRALEAKARSANVIRRQGRLAEAESIYLETLEQMIALVGEEDVKVVRVRENVAFCLWMQNRYAEAVVIFEDVLRQKRQLLGDDAPETLRTISSLSNSYTMIGRYAEAEELIFETIEVTKRNSGVDHPDYITSLESLATLYVQQDEMHKAEELVVEIYRSRRKTGGKEHPATLIAMHNLAEVQYELGKYEEAEQLARKALAARVRLRGEEHLYTQQTRWSLAKIIIKRGAYDEAMQCIQIAVDHGFANEQVFDAEYQAAFEPLHGRPEYKALLVNIRERLKDD